MPRYLVTGGCGFIGSHLVDALLAAGHEVRVLDDLSTGTLDYLPPGATLLRGDVADPALAREAVRGVDGCFHLAAIASVQRCAEDLLGTHRTNLGGTVALLDGLAREGRAPFVYASSAAVYGDCAICPVGEDTPAQPQSAYGADKRASELHAAVASHGQSIPTTGLRFFNVYGPRQRWDSPYSGVVSIFADRIRRGLPVTVFGDGGQTRDLVQVGDVVTALLRAMARPRLDAPVFNVCTGQGVSVLGLVAELGRLLGRTAPIEFAPPRPGEIRHSVGDPARGRAELALPAPTPLADGLRGLLRYSQAAATASTPNRMQARR